MWDKTKIYLKTTIIVILIEIILVAIIGGYVYYNYDKISKSDSWVSKAKIEKVKLKEVNLEEIEEKKEPEKKKSKIYTPIYSWLMGNIEAFSLKEKKKGLILYKTWFRYSLDNDKIKKVLLVKYLKDNRLLDKYILVYIFKDNHKDIWETFNKLVFFFDILGMKNKDLSNLFQKYYAEHTKEITKLYKEEKMEELWKELKQLEKDMKKDLKENLLGKNKIIASKEFQYILSLILDKDSYFKDVKEISDKVGIDPKLLAASISVEQIRFLSTQRGKIKTIIKNNKALRSFTKFSYGLWGIKTFTFRNINKWMKQYDFETYQKYFAYYDNKVKEIKNNPENKDKSEEEIKELEDLEIKKILENNYSGLLYSAWLIKSIILKWDKAWFDISDRPWIILTLYNMGNTKTPHWNPDLGGSIIQIGWYDKYFGELWYLFYFYMKVYLYK